MGEPLLVLTGRERITGREAHGRIGPIDTVRRQSPEEHRILAFTPHQAAGL